MFVTVKAKWTKL